MKAILKGSSETQRFSLHVPLEEFLQAALDEKERELYRDYKVDIYSDTRRHDDGEDDTIVITFTKSREYERKDEDMLLVEVPSKPLPRCASKSDIAKLEEKIEALRAGSGDTDDSGQS